MALLESRYLTMVDLIKRLDPDGKTAAIVEMLSQTNEMLLDATFVEANNISGHQFTMRTGLPSVYWKLMNRGTPVSKSTTAQVTEQCAMLESFSEIDCDEAELSGDVKAFRLSEQSAFTEAMNQEMQQTTIYGSAANPEEFVGFANRFSSMSAGNAQNIIRAGGSGSDNTSIMLICWGAPCSMIYPKGSKVGLEHKDLGKQMIQTTVDGAPARMLAYVDRWIWKTGLCLRDWRYVVRIANIDVSDLAALSSTQAITASTSIIKLMSNALNRVPSLKGVKPVFYCNRTVKEYLDVIGLEKSASAVKVEEAMDQFGRPFQQYMFRGIPIRTVDQIINTEGAVS